MEDDSSEDGDDAWEEEIPNSDVSNSDHEDVQKSVSRLCRHLRKISSFFRRSNRASELLREKTGRQEKVPIEMKIRWSSTYHMMKFFEDGYGDVQYVLSQILSEASSSSERMKINELFLSEDETNQVKLLLPLLQKFMIATETLSGQNYPTTDKCIQFG